MSFHRARLSGPFLAGCGFAVLACVGLGGMVLLGAGGVQAQLEGKSLSAVLVVFCGLLVGLVFAGPGGPVCAASAGRPTSRSVPAACVPGPPTAGALRAEVADIRCDVKFVQPVRQSGLVGAMQQWNNPQPPYPCGHPDDHPTLRESYRMSPAGVTHYFKLADTASTLWTEDGRRRVCPHRGSLADGAAGEVTRPCEGHARDHTSVQRRCLGSTSSASKSVSNTSKFTLPVVGSHPPLAHSGTDSDSNSR